MKFYPKIWTSKIFEKYSFLVFRIVAIPKKNTWKKIIFLEIQMYTVSNTSKKTDSWHLLCKVTFVNGEVTFIMCSSVHFAPKIQVCADSPERFYLLSLSLGSPILQNTRILSGMLNAYSKTKIKNEKKECCFHVMLFSGVFVINFRKERVSIERIKIKF